MATNATWWKRLSIAGSAILAMAGLLISASPQPRTTSGRRPPESRRHRTPRPIPTLPSLRFRVRPSAIAPPPAATRSALESRKRQQPPRPRARGRRPPKSTRRPVQETASPALPSEGSLVRRVATAPPPGATSTPLGTGKRWRPPRPPVPGLRRPRSPPRPTPGPAPPDHFSEGFRARRSATAPPSGVTSTPPGTIK